LSIKVTGISLKGTPLLSVNSTCDEADGMSLCRNRPPRMECESQTSDWPAHAIFCLYAPWAMPVKSRSSGKSGTKVRLE
jgi:hypothetical protein